MIYFMRHGQSQANADGVFAGPSYPSPLTEQGRVQARSESERLRAEGIVIDRIITSPVERAKDTAEIIAQAAGLDVSSIQYDSRLVEYDMGALSGKPKAGIGPRQRTSASDAEDPIVFQARVMACLEDIHALSGNTLVVAHAGVAGIIEATRIGSDLRDFYSEGYPNARVVELDYGALIALK
jgi:broad specificity phosphatase PhoE